MRLRLRPVVVMACCWIWAANVPAGEPPPGSGDRAIPASWLASWKDPPPSDRPLQIIHGIRPLRGPAAGTRPAAAAEAEDPFTSSMRFYKERGLGGVVSNVAFDHYLTSEENWKALEAGVEACRKLGMVVWLYDEEGYPSGAAGGLVLKENPQFEAIELAFDPSRPDPFLLRPAYEHTHASNNFHAARRYINLIDDRAVRSFLHKTHDAYRDRLEKHFGHTIEAIFTDEPSLVAVNLGQLPEEVRKRVRVVDPLDPAVRPLPAVPWSYDLPERYRERFGEDLTPHRRSLFEGDSPEDRKVREQFWGLIADLVAERYFGAIQKWCGESRIASSGHILWEEEIMHHPALEGNGLKMLARMDIPGLDMLTSQPAAVIHSGWMAAALPASAAMLTGRRRVMTEISDFSEKMSGRGPAGLAEMQAAAAWQAAWGVTDFTLYYGIRDRPAEDYRAYCDYVGRLNAILKPARWEPEVLLYYPVRDLWAEYRPVAEPLRLASQPSRAQRIVQSFTRLGQTLQRNQVPFALVDHEFLAAASVRPDGSLAVAGRQFRWLVVPEDAQLPPAAAKIVAEARAKGLCVLSDGPKSERLSAGRLLEQIRPSCRLAPASEQVALGRFARDEQTVFLLVNVGQAAYQGDLSAGGAGHWTSLDPASGSIHAVKTNDTGRLPLALAPRQAILLVGTR